MDYEKHHQQLIEYIRSHRAHGSPDGYIRQTLLQHNWQPEWVNKAFAELQTTPPQLAPVSQPQKYRVFRAIKDVYGAIRRNTVGYIAAVIGSIILAVGLFFVMAAVTSLIAGTSGLEFGISSAMIVAGIMAGLLYMAWYVVAYGLIVAATSLALLDGVNGVKSDVIGLFKKALPIMLRVFAANALFAIIVYGPYILALLLEALLILTHVVGGGLNGIVILSLSAIVCLVWGIIASLRYALIPFIAVFEPNIPLLKLPARSFHLVKKGGQWFIFKLFVLFIGLFVILAIITGNTLETLANGIGGGIVITLLSALVSIFVEGALVMLYLNRRNVRQ